MKKSEVFPHSFLINIIYKKLMEKMEKITRIGIDEFHAKLQKAKEQRDEKIRLFKESLNELKKKEVE